MLTAVRRRCGLRTEHGVAAEKRCSLRATITPWRQCLALPTARNCTQIIERCRNLFTRLRCRVQSLPVDSAAAWLLHRSFSHTHRLKSEICEEKVSGVSAFVIISFLAVFSCTAEVCSKFRPWLVWQNSKRWHGAPASQPCRSEHRRFQKQNCYPERLFTLFGVFWR